MVVNLEDLVGADKEEPPNILNSSTDILEIVGYICDVRENGNFAMTYLKPGSKPDTSKMVDCNFGKQIVNEKIKNDIYFYSNAYKKGGIVNKIKVTAKKYIPTKKNGNGNSTLMPQIDGISKIELMQNE